MKFTDIDGGSFLTRNQNGMSGQVVDQRSGNNSFLIIGRFVLTGKIPVGEKTASEKQENDDNGQENLQEAMFLFGFRCNRLPQRAGQMPGSCALILAISPGKYRIIGVTFNEGSVFIHKTHTVAQFGFFPACFFIA